jgi:hypothetical protein
MYIFPSLYASKYKCWPILVLKLVAEVLFSVYINAVARNGFRLNYV